MVDTSDVCTDNPAPLPPSTHLSAYLSVFLYIDLVLCLRLSTHLRRTLTQLLPFPQNRITFTHTMLRLNLGLWTGSASAAEFVLKVLKLLSLPPPGW